MIDLFLNYKYINPLIVTISQLSEMSMQSYLVLNGQRIPVDEEEVQLKLIDEEKDSFIHMSCGAINIKWNITLTFVLRNNSEMDKEGYRKFLLALHDFNCIKLSYTSESIAQLIDSFIVEVYGKLREIEGDKQREKETEVQSHLNAQPERLRFENAMKCLEKVVKNHEEILRISEVNQNYSVNTSIIMTF